MKQKMQQWLVRPQGKLGPLGLVVLLVTASLVTPLSLDMYTPAVPHMTEAFDTTAGTVNLTLVGYFLFFAVGLLVFGPLSDRYGRRPVLLAGVVTYTSASGLCALALEPFDRSGDNGCSPCRACRCAEYRQLSRERCTDDCAHRGGSRREADGRFAKPCRRDGSPDAGFARVRRKPPFGACRPKTPQ